MNAPVEIFQEPESSQVMSLTDALTTGGVFYRISGSDKESALKAVVEVMRLPDDARPDDHHISHSHKIGRQRTGNRPRRKVTIP